MLEHQSTCASYCSYSCSKADLTPVCPVRENIKSLQSITDIHSTVCVSLKPPVSFRNVLDFSDRKSVVQGNSVDLGWFRFNEKRSLTRIDRASTRNTLISTSLCN